ncbi:hypothetical protein Q1695_012675 [Nippostrongylus brasiliensis]|nr:hypothetical protein Q1695_012675 [Nippostrongylus brasiliensis]
MVVYCAQFGNGQVVGGLALNGKKPNNTIISNVSIEDVTRTASVRGALQRLDPNRRDLLNLSGSYRILLSTGPTQDNRLGYHQNNRYVLPRTLMSAYVRGIGFVEAWLGGRHRVTGEMEMVRVGFASAITYSDSVEKVKRLQSLLLLFFVVVAIGTAVAFSVPIGKKPVN